MIKYITAAIFFILLSPQFFAQQKIDSVAGLKNEFESFEYINVINNADQMLSHRNDFSSEDLIEIFMMKGVSQFSLSDDNGAQKSFEEILKINPSYQLDSTKTSPKIISFFNLVKQAYNQNIVEKNKVEKTKTDTVYITKPVTVHENEADMKQALFRSVLLPGLGHFYLNESGKGFIITALSVAALTSSIYYIIDSNKKQNAYLNETNSLLIPQKYNSYNSSYKMRNISIVAYAAVWLYSQIDIIFFQHQFDSASNTAFIAPQVDFKYSYNVRLNFNIAF